MNSFDHKNRKESYGATRSRNDRSETSFNREDSRRSTREENALSTFSRDKRPRSQHTPTMEGQGGSASGFRKENNRRRSFNPNFTKDNRRTDQVRSTRRDDTDTTGTKTPNLPRVRDTPSPANRSTEPTDTRARIHGMQTQNNTGQGTRDVRTADRAASRPHRIARPIPVSRLRSLKGPFV